MDIDIYQQCPCHAEKKIKFCCGKDIVADLNQILAKNSAGQHQAALDQLGRAIQKTGPRDCLLTIQTHIQITHGEIDAAKESNAQFLANNPNHSTGLHHLALIQLAEGDIEAAVETLQDAMEAIVGNEIPVSFSSAFKMVGLGLLQAGHLIGARAHLEYSLGLKNGNDPEVRQMILETFRMPGSPLLLKQDFKLQPLPEEFAEAEWAKKYINAGRSLDRGQFRRGLRFLKKIDSQFPDLPIVLRGIAVLHLYLGNHSEINPAWVRFSLLPGLSEIAAIEANAIGQVFASADEADNVPIKRFSYELTELERPLEITLSNRRFAAAELPTEDPFAEGRAPRNAFYLLDKELVKSATELNLDNVSAVTGEVLFYGKQTDRPARLEWATDATNPVESLKSDLQQWFGEFFQGEPIETVIGSTSRLGRLMAWDWQFPEDMTPEKHSELMEQKLRIVLLEEWIELPAAALGGKTPREAVSIPELKVPLQGLLLQFEESQFGQAYVVGVVEELRDKLNIPLPAKIPWTFSQSLTPSPIELQHLDHENLSDDNLLSAVNLAMMFGNLGALRLSLPEILRRPETDALPRDRAYLMMARLSDDLDTGLDYLAKARAEAKKHNRSTGIYLVEEFEFRIARGSTEKLPALLQTIQLHHLEDPEVAYRLRQVLERYGLVENGPAGRPPMPAGAASVAGSSPGSKTADWSAATNAPAASAASETPEPSKLWIPD